MQLISLSKITVLALVTSSLLHAENYISVEYLQYDESDNRVTVMAPTVSASLDIGTDINIKADFVNDAVSGATPTFSRFTRQKIVNDSNSNSNVVTPIVKQPDTQSGGSSRKTTQQKTINVTDYKYINQTFDEERNAGSGVLTFRFDNRDELIIAGDYSSESDFESTTGSLEYMHYIDSSHNQSVTMGVGYTYNDVLGFQTDTLSGGSGGKESSDSLNIALGFSQILSKTSLAKVSIFGINDTGYLTNPHATVVRNYGTAFVRLARETRPDNRLAYGVDLQYITQLKEGFTYQGDYRLYHDDWEINSFTLTNDFYYEISDSFTLGLGLRYYNQSSAFFYNGTKDFFTREKEATSDVRLSGFDAFTYKANIGFKQNSHLSYHFNAEFYDQSTTLSATSFMIGAKYTF